MGLFLPGPQTRSAWTSCCEAAHKPTLFFDMVVAAAQSCAWVEWDRHRAKLASRGLVLVEIAFILRSLPLHEHGFPKEMAASTELKTKDQPACGNEVLLFPLQLCAEVQVPAGRGLSAPITWRGCVYCILLIIRAGIQIRKKIST